MINLKNYYNNTNFLNNPNSFAFEEIKIDLVKDLVELYRKIATELPEDILDSLNLTWSFL